MKAQINIYQQGFLYALQNSISVNWNYAAEMYLHSSPLLSSEMFENVFQISLLSLFSPEWLLFMNKIKKLNKNVWEAFTMITECLILEV